MMHCWPNARTHVCFYQPLELFSLCLFVYSRNETINIFSYCSTFRPTWYNSAWSYLDSSNILIEYGAILIPDNISWFSTNTFVAA